MLKGILNKVKDELGVFVAVDIFFAYVAFEFSPQDPNPYIKDLQNASFLIFLIVSLYLAGEIMRYSFSDWKKFLKLKFSGDMLWTTLVLLFVVSLALLSFGVFVFYNLFMFGITHESPLVSLGTKIITAIITFLLAGLLIMRLCFIIKNAITSITSITSVTSMNIRAVIPPFILQTLVYPATWLGLRFFTNIRISGRENLRGLRSGAIFAVNHASELDPILVPATLPFLSPLMPMFYIARDREFYEKKGPTKYFYGGLFFKLWGAYPAFVGIGDYAQALRHHIGILLSGHSVCIFPEGGKTHDGTVREGKPGVAYLLWRTGRPVVPIAIHGHYGMCAGDFLGRTRTIAVSYGKPITREELFGAVDEKVEPTKEELKEATAKIMARIREMYEVN